MTDKQFNAMQEQFGFMQEQFNAMQVQFAELQRQLKEVDNRLSNEIKTVREEVKAGDRELDNHMSRNKFELKRLIEDRAEMNGREHQVIIDTLEKRYQDLDRRVKEVRGDIDTVDVVNKYEHEAYNKALKINPLGR